MGNIDARPAVKNCLLSVFFLLVAVSGVSPAPAFANTEARLQSQIDELNSEIDSSQSHISSLRQRKDTLENRVGIINAEIKELDNQLKLTAVSIEQTENRLAGTERLIERNINLIRENSRTLYKNGNPSIIELLFSSNNFSDFISRQEYLSSVRASTNQALAENKAAKKELQKKEVELQNLQRQNQAQKKVAQDKRSQQRELLQQTRGEESRYRSVVSEQKRQLAAAEVALDEIRDCVVRGGNWNDGQKTCVMPPPVPAPRPSTGNVSGPGPSLAPATGPSAGGTHTTSRGQVIGAMGSTGLSTGPHLHFEVITPAGNVINPHNGGRSIVNGYSWPVGGSGGYISQAFGCTSLPFYGRGPACPSSAPYWHTGLDIAGPAGTPILAAANGDIITRAYLGGYGNVVIMRHPDGFKTLYAHLLH